MDIFITSTPGYLNTPQHACRHCWKRVLPTEIHYCGGWSRGCADFVSLDQLRMQAWLMRELLGLDLERIEKEQGR